MPVTLHFYDNGVVLRHTGLITDKELIHAENEIYSHDYPEMLHFQIVDLSDVTDFRVSQDTMRYLGQKDNAMAKILTRQHIVVVAPKNSRIKTIIWQSWAQEEKTDEPNILTEIVDSIIEAKRWLKNYGIEIPSEPPTPDTGT